jgi:hypothetical protein
MTYLVDFITPIFQILTIELKDYYMNLRTTKCLNTSIMTMYLLLGTEGLKTSEVCSVQNIRKRIKNNTDKLNNMDETVPQNVNDLASASRSDSKIRLKEMAFYDQMIDDLFDNNDPKRVFYYIMITDGSMTRSHSQKNDVTKEDYFPGHVFVIEKIPCSTKPKFKLYQSFIGEYTLKGHFNKNHKSLKMSGKELKKILGKTGILNNKDKIDGVSTIFTDNIWSPRTTEMWEKLTHVKSDNYNGFSTKELRFCYQKIYVDTCFSILNKFANKALNNLNKDINYYDVENPADPALPGDKLKETIEVLERQTRIMQKEDNA